MDNYRTFVVDIEYGVRYVQLYCYADADVVRQRFTGRVRTDSRPLSAIEGVEGLQVLANYIRQGFQPLNIDSTIIKVGTTDFSKLDEASIIGQLRDATREVHPANSAT